MEQENNEMRIELTGTPNLGKQEERTEKFAVMKSITGPDRIVVYNGDYAEPIISFNPFFDGGSIRTSVSQVILSGNDDGEDDIMTNYYEVRALKEKAKELEKLKESLETIGNLFNVKKKGDE